MYEKNLNSVTFIGSDEKEHTLRVGDRIRIAVPHGGGAVQTVSGIACQPDGTHIQFRTQGGFADRAGSWGRVWVLDGEEFPYLDEDDEEDDLN